MTEPSQETFGDRRPTELDKFIGLVCQMRHDQRSYERTLSVNKKKVAAASAAKVDAWLDARKDPQQSLF